jgi:ABC-type transporter Mla maintaining outer membrane lipid asymmetry ATPase subunit MlaF
VRSAEAFALLEMTDVSKDYHGLRPLRIARLSVAPGEQVSLVGFDQSTAEIFVNLVTGASLPDRGSIRLFGRHTSDIKDSDDWLTVVDRFGIVSRRSVLLDAMTVVQNLAMPFTLDIEPPAPDVRDRAEALAREVGIAGDAINRPIVELDPLTVFAVRLGRALALNPSVLLFEHPTAEVAPADIGVLAARCRTVAARRNIAAVVLTADREFAAAAASRVLTLDPASGRLSGEGWFSRFRRA